jgi:hypothetical protein
VVHGNAIAYGNGIDLKGYAPATPHPGFNRLGNLGQVYMSGDNLGKAVDDPDEGLIYVSPSPAYGVQQGAVRSTLYTSFGGIAFHIFPHLNVIFYYKKSRPVGTAHVAAKPHSRALLHNNKYQNDIQRVHYKIG